MLRLRSTTTLRWMVRLQCVCWDKFVCYILRFCESALAALAQYNNVALDGEIIIYTFVVSMLDAYMCVCV